MYALGERHAMPMMPRNAIRLARVGHWTKNALVLLPVVFAPRMDDVSAWVWASMAAGAFCLASSGVYILNDIADRDRDRLHPAKRDRPLASGQVGTAAALVEAGVLFACAAALALAVRPAVLGVAGAYVLLQIVYTVWLKKKMIVDVICIAGGFVLRAMAGAVAIDVVISPWLVICTFTGCLFLGFCKRRNEQATLGDVTAATGHRKTLAGYTGDLLTHLITLSAAIAIVSFLLYASSKRTTDHIHTIALVYTLPLVVYGVCRFAMISMHGLFTDPMDILVHDGPLQLTAVAWLAASACIVTWGRELGQWLGT